MTDGFNMKSIKNLFQEAEERSEEETSSDIEVFMDHLEQLTFHVELTDEDKSVVYYYARARAH